MDLKQIKSLQGLRGIAILLVIFSHFDELVINSYSQNALNWLGAFGVSIFIMLSGCLSILKNNVEKINYKRKLMKFINKSAPLHILMLIIMLPFSMRQSDATINVYIKLFFNMCMLHAWIPIRSVYFSFNVPSWYLGLSIFSYLLHQ